MNWKHIDKYGETYKLFENGDIFKGADKVESFMDKKLNIPYVLLKRGKNSCSHSVARLVYETFVGKINSNYRLKYKDDDVNNVALNNLEIVYRFNKEKKEEPKEAPKQLAKLKWKYIDGCNNKYKIYENGDIYEGNIKVEPFIHHRYKVKFVSLSDTNDHKANHMVAKLVYGSFNDIKVGENYLMKYKDDDSNNVHLNNLEMVSRRQMAALKKVSSDTTKI